MYINSLLNISTSCLKPLYCGPTIKALQSTIICSRMSSFWTSRCVTIELFILSMIFYLNFVLAVSVTGHSRMKCFRFSIPFPHVGSTVYWLNFDLFACKVYVPVSILAFIAAFSTSFGLFLTVFHTGWHTPIWSWLTEVVYQHSSSHI